MDGLLKTIADLIVKGGPEALAALGWLLYVLERYYVAPKKEKEYRADLKEFRDDYAALGQNMSEVFSRFSTILEVIKDRMRNT